MKWEFHQMRWKIEKKKRVVKEKLCKVRQKNYYPGAGERLGG